MAMDTGMMKNSFQRLWGLPGQMPADRHAKGRCGNPLSNNLQLIKPLKKNSQEPNWTADNGHGTFVAFLSGGRFRMTRLVLVTPQR